MLIEIWEDNLVPINLLQMDHLKLYDDTRSLLNNMLRTTAMFLKRICSKIRDRVNTQAVFGEKHEASVRLIR